MRLYHGSNVMIEQPDLSYSKPFKDFGRGFYLSPIREQAEERAKQMVDILQEGFLIHSNVFPIRLQDYITKVQAMCMIICEMNLLQVK